MFGSTGGPTGLVATAAAHWRGTTRRTALSCTRLCWAVLGFTVAVLWLYCGCTHRVPSVKSVAKSSTSAAPHSRRFTFTQFLKVLAWIWIHSSSRPRICIDLAAWPSGDLAAKPARSASDIRRDSSVILPPPGTGPAAGPNLGASDENLSRGRVGSNKSAEQ